MVTLYSSNARGGSNKRVDWIFCPNLISGYLGSNNSGEDGKNFICVGEKQKKLEIFLNINKRGGSNNSG